MEVSEIKYVKSIIDLLNEYFPPFVYQKKYTGEKILLQHNFTCYFDSGFWNICCSHYWTYIGYDFQSIKDNLLLIAEEDNVNIKFIHTHPMTSLVRRNNNIQEGRIFMGRVDIKSLA